MSSADPYTLSWWDTLVSLFHSNIIRGEVAAADREECIYLRDKEIERLRGEQDSLSPAAVADFSVVEPHPVTPTAV